jgi:NADH-quinone oxidoreductase subunit J
MVGALLLLLAMIGAIILTIFHEKNLKRQDLFVQITTKYSETVKNINVK